MGLNSWLLLVGGSLLALFVLKTLVGYLAPFLAGIAIAVLMDPAVDYCERKGCPRPVASLILVLIVFGSLLFLLAVAAAGLWHEIGQLAGVIQDCYEGGLQSIDSINRLAGRLPDYVQSLIPPIISSVSQLIVGVFAEILSRVKKVPAFLLSWLMAGMTAFFVSRDKKGIVRFIAAQLPEKWRSVFFGLKHTLRKSTFAYFKTQLVLMWVSLCVAVSGFLLVDHPYAWVLGILAGLLDLIPLIGPSGVFIPVIVYNLAAGTAQRSVFLAAVWLVLLLVRQLCEPRLVGSEVGLHPLTAMAGIYLGAKLMGVWGVIFGPMALILFKTVYYIVNDAS